MRTIRNIAFALVGLFAASCCCFEPALQEQDGTVIVREATLPEFNSTIVGSNPDPSFNIAMFKFPASVQSSGELPNDGRFANGTYTSIEANYPKRDLTSYYVFSSPPNSIMAGDFMVVDVDPTARVATMRVSGRLAKLPNNPALTDNAATFADEIRKYVASMTPTAGLTVCQMFEAQTVLYGTTTAVPGQSFDKMFVKTNSGADTNVVYPTNWPVDAATGMLLPPIKESSDIGFYNITVNPGDWFYYKAKNGMAFFVVVTNIQSGILVPYINRVTFKFAEAYQCLDCKK